MKLSERGAIKSAICDGGFSIFPAGALYDYIKRHLKDDFKGDFDTAKTAAKIESVSITGDAAQQTILKADLELLASRLKKMSPDYNIESVFEKISHHLPAMAEHYFGIKDYKPVKTEVIEFFFEGYNDLYKDADWNAFNIDARESKEYSVPIGIYFKRSQVAPGYPEFVTMHENVHQFMSDVNADGITGYYVPWIAEGFADIFGRLMLYRATKDADLLRKSKNIVVELDYIDSRKATYNYEDQIALQFAKDAGLPYTKAFFKTVSEHRHEFDWSLVGQKILEGRSPRSALMSGYTGTNRDAVEQNISRWAYAFKKDGEFDEDDMMVLNYFSLVQKPATLIAKEYTAAKWIMDQLYNNRGNHYVSAELAEKVREIATPASRARNDNDCKQVIKIGTLNSDELNKIPKGHGAFLICKDDIPENLHDAAEKLGNYFMIVKKEVGGKIYFDVYGGGLPYRMETGELRCSIA